ncbi:MAG: glycoside hydrolase family 88 protein [Melioribacteraceae bacterium]|nr:glycoside hydrolase family 88 protein [Melioribacteraceae bacterium]
MLISTRILQLLFVVSSILIFINCNSDDNLLLNEIQPWSVRLAESFYLKHPDAVTYNDVMKDQKWNYEQGVILEALRRVYLEYDIQKYFEFLRKNIEKYVDTSGTIHRYEYDDFNLDNINPGRQLLFLHEKTGKAKYKIAADMLRMQLENQPRTKTGGFWHKKIYPYQMWLDGLYMAQPFYAKYISLFGDSSGYDDVVHQFQIIYDKTRDPETGLLYHAWNENREQKWADPETGRSPHVWGRAMGWFMMALVDVLEILPENYSQKQVLIKILNETSQSIVKYRDNDSQLWFQLIAFNESDGNYLESSCAAMFTYAFAKGARFGWLDPEYLKIAKESFTNIISHHITIDKDGHIYLHNTCAGAGLGGNPYRDGSFEYYVSVPKNTNDYKGYGPLIYAAIELEKQNEL